MPIPKTMQESEQLYQEIKKFFGSRVCDKVIEISDTPMSEWVVHYPASENEMFNLRINLDNDNIPFAAFGLIDKNTGFNYHYNDPNIGKSEEIFSGEVTYYHDNTFCEYDFDKIRNELKQLMKIAA
jgi:hypothetical protein